MDKPLAESKTFSTLSAAVDQLRREFDELQQLREAVAEAERSDIVESRARELGRCPEVLERLPAVPRDVAADVRK